MEVSLKIQHLKESDENPKGEIVFTHEFDLPQEQMLEKRGRLFAVSSISAKGDFDLPSITTLFVETVQENYYRATEDTPLHALEKSLERAYNTLLTYRSFDDKTTLGTTESHLKFSFVIALIWNKVLYVSYLGKPAAYLIRGAGVRNLASDTSHSEIWTSSSILDDDDVLIIGTEDFAAFYPANEISNNLGSISQTIRTHENKDRLKAILIKISIKQANASQGVIDRIRQTKITGSISSTLKNVQDKVIPKKKLSDKFKFYQNKKAAPVSSISSLVSNGSERTSLITSTKRIPKNKASSFNMKRLAIGLLMLGTASFLMYRSFISDDKNEENLVARNEELIDDKKFSSVMGAQSPNLKYSIIIDTGEIDDDMLPVDLALLNERNIVLLNKANKSLIKIDTSTGQFSKISDDFSDPTLVECAAATNTELCALYGNKTIYVISPKTPDDIDKYVIDLEDVTDIYPYANAIYILTSTDIYRLSLTSKEAPKSWLASDQSFFNATSFVVDGDIYVLTNNRIYKYYSGNRVTDFTVDSKYLHDPAQLVIRENELYILNRADNAIVVFEKTTGKFVKEIKIEGTLSDANNILFTITETENGHIVFLDGQYIYKINLSGIETDGSNN